MEVVALGVGLVGIVAAYFILRPHPHPPPPPPENWSQVPIGNAVLDSTTAAYFETLRPTDYVIIPFSAALNTLLPTLTQGIIFQAFTALNSFEDTTDTPNVFIDGVITNIGNLDTAAVGVSYDLEHWGRSPVSEQNDPVGSVAAMATAAHGAGKLAMAVPSSDIASPNLAAMAPLVDVFGLQAGHKQYTAVTNGTADPVGWSTYMNASYAALKAANPAVKVWVQYVVGTVQTSASGTQSPGPIPGTNPSDMITAINLLNFTPDVLVIFALPSNLTYLQQAVALLRPNG